jgi:hypothetical protein
MAECHMKNEGCGFRCTGYDGSEQWARMEKIVDSIECDECRDHGKAGLSGWHDTVNINLGKKPYNADNFRTFASEVSCALDRCTRNGTC